MRITYTKLKINVIIYEKYNTISNYCNNKSSTLRKQKYNKERHNSRQLHLHQHTHNTHTQHST